MVVELVAADELAEEVALLVAQRVLQQIARPRIVQLQHAHDEVGHVERLGTAVHDLLAGDVDDLTELHRGFGVVVTVVGHGLDGLESFLEPLDERVGRIEYVQHPVEGELVGKHPQQVFGHDEFVAVLLAALHRVVQHLDGALGLMYFCHNYSSGSTVRRSGNPASRAIAVALRTFDVATS